MATYYSKLSLNGNTLEPLASSLFGTCNTLASVSAKQVILPNFDRITDGVTIHIKFTYGNNAPLDENLTLKVGASDAYHISNPGGTSAWAAGAVLSFTYDSASQQWNVNDGSVTTTTIESTYNPQSEEGISGKGVAAALATLGAAAQKDVITAIRESEEDGNTDSTDLPTTAAVVNFLNSKPDGVRVYRQSTGFNADYPLLASRSLASAIGTPGINGSYTNKIYAVIWNDTSKIPTINPSTGKIKAVLFEGSGANLTNINAENISTGFLNVDRLPSTGAAAGAYGPTANKTLSHGETFNVPQVTVDEKGRVLSITSRQMRLPTDDSSDVLIPYGVCESGGNTSTKSVSLTPDISANFGYAAGAQILVRFRSTNTAYNATLNIGDGDNVPIYYNGEPIGVNMLLAGRTYGLVYDGNYWNVISDIDTDTWRPVVNTLTSDDTDSSLSAAQGKELKRQIDLKTNNLGTITQINTGVGLAGGPITESGTIKVKLRSETALLGESTNAAETTNRLYAIVVDNSGNLAVSVPWTDTNTQVTQTATSTDASYRILFSESASDETLTECARKASGLSFNPANNTLLIGTGTLTPTQYSGNAATATTATSANAVAWANITGRPTLSVAGLSLGLNDTIDHEISAAALRTALGLANALHLIGRTTISNGVLVVPQDVTPINGDILLADNKEFLYLDGTWEELGDETSFKVKQTAITDSGVQNSITFVSRISQDANGVITVTKTEIPFASILTEGIVSTVAQSFAGLKTFINGIKVKTSDGTHTLNITGNTVEAVSIDGQDVEFYDTLELQPHGGTINLGSSNDIQLNIHGSVSLDGPIGFGTAADDGLHDHEHIIQIGGSLAFLSDTNYITHMDLIEDENENVDMYFYPHITGTGYIGQSAYRWNSLYLTNSIAIGAPRHEKFTVAADGTMSLSGTTNVITLTSSGAAWTLINNVNGELSLTDGTIVMNGREDGFEINSALYINATIPQSNTFNLYVNGTSLFTGSMWISATTDSTTTQTGALRIDGGVGIAKNVNIGGKVGIGANIDTNNNDPHQLVISGSTLIKVANQSFTYDTVHLDVRIENTNGWADFYPETNNTGLIGTTTNKWYRAYFSDLINVGSGFTAQGTGVLDLSAGTAIINLNNTASGGVNWQIKNAASTFTIINAANNTYIKGTTIQGFEITPRLYINEAMGNGNSDNLYVNGTATILTGLGIGVGSQSGKALTVNDSAQFVHRAGANITSLAHLLYHTTLTLNTWERFSFHPHTDKTGLIGLEDHRWYNLYLYHSLMVANDNSDTITIATPEDVSSSQALIRLNSGSNARVIDLHTQIGQDAEIKVTTDRTSPNNSVLTLDSMSPRIVLDSARIALPEENTSNASFDWVIANETGTFNIYNVGDNNVSFQGNATGFDFYGILRIHQSFILDSILSSRTYNEGAFVVYGGVGIGKELNVNGSIAGKDKFTLVHTFGELTDDPIEHTPLVQMYYDDTTGYILFYPEYVAESNMRGYIGTQANRWTEIYLKEKVNLVHNQNNLIDLTSNGAIVTMTAAAPIITMNSTAANAPAWSISNSAGQLHITSGTNAEYINGIPGVGFVLEPRIFLNVGANNLNTNTYVLDIEPYSTGNATIQSGKINLYVGIGTESDYVRQSPNVETAARLVVNGGFKVVQDANNQLDVIIAETGTSLSRLYPGQNSFENYLGTNSNRWTAAYLSTLLNIRHTDASGNKVDEVSLIAETDADGGLTASFTSTNVITDSNNQSGLILTTGTNKSATLTLITPHGIANEESTFTIHSTNPKFILDSNTATWQFMSVGGVLYITTGDNREQIKGIQNNGFNIAKRLYINDTNTLGNAVYHLLVNSDTANNPAYIRLNGQVGIGANVDYYRSQADGAVLIVNQYMKLVSDSNNNEADIVHFKYNSTAQEAEFYPQTNGTGAIGIQLHWWRTGLFTEKINIGNVIDLDYQTGLTLSAYTPTITFAPTIAGQNPISWHMSLSQGIFTWGDRDENNYIQGSSTGWIINPSLVIGETQADTSDYGLYVAGDTFFDGEVVFGHGLSIQDSIKPTDDNETSLGDDNHHWAAIHLGPQDHYGAEYLPVYWANTGLPTVASRIIQCYPFSFAVGSTETIVGVNDPALDSSSVVIQMVITDGEQYLRAQPTWEYSGSTPKGMKINMLLSADHIITGYIITMRTSMLQDYHQGYTHSSFNMTSWKAMQLTKAAGSNDQAIFINSSGVPTGITYTTNKLYYASTENTYITSKHHVEDTAFKVNWYTGTPSHGNVNFYVNGTSYFTNNISLGDTEQYYIDNNANTRIASLTISGSSDKNKSNGDGRGIALITQTDGSTPEIGLFAGTVATFGMMGATAGTTAAEYAMYFNTKYLNSQIGGWVFRATGSTSTNVYTMTTDGKFYFNNTSYAGLYWSPVSQDSDDSASIYRTINGTTTALILDVGNDTLYDYIEFKTPGIIKINNKNAFTDAGSFTLNIGDGYQNINFGGNLIKSNNAITIYSDVSQSTIAFTANSSGIVYALAKGRIGTAGLMTDDTTTLIVKDSIKVMDIDSNPIRTVFEAARTNSTFKIAVPSTITGYIGDANAPWDSLYLKTTLQLLPGNSQHIIAAFGTQATETTPIYTGYISLQSNYTYIDLLPLGTDANIELKHWRIANYDGGFGIYNGNNTTSFTGETRGFTLYGGSLYIGASMPIIVPNEDPPILYDLYVHGTSWLNGATVVDSTLTVNGNILPGMQVTESASNPLYTLGRSGTNNTPINSLAAVFIGTHNSYGNSTTPIYWDNGVPTATSYTMSASIGAASAANKLAYYNGIHSITAGSITTNGSYITGVEYLTITGTQNTNITHVLSIVGKTSAGGNIEPMEDQILNLGTSSLKWGKVYVGSAASYGSTTRPIYWNDGVPTAISYTANRFYYSAATDSFAAANHYVTSTQLFLNKILETNEAINDTLYVNGTTYLNSNATIAGNFLPSVTNTDSLGTGGSTAPKRWSGVFIGTADTYGSGTQPIYWNNGAPTASTANIGDAYTPIYSNAGVLTAVTPVVQMEFTIAADKYGVQLNHAAYTNASFVLQIVVDSGESYLNAPLNWSSDAGYIKVYSTTQVSGQVHGYILVSRGAKLTATSTSDISTLS